MVKQKYRYQIDRYLPGFVKKTVIAGTIPATQINEPTRKPAITGREQQQQSLKIII
jgi:hypothetical protein